MSVLTQEIDNSVRGLICKMDFGKAYDKVDWGLLYMLHGMGFGTKWRKWIRICVSSTHFSIMVNGSPKVYFKSSKGSWQGDPLSPMPFVIVAETLIALLEKARLTRLISGFAIANSDRGNPFTICG